MAYADFTLSSLVKKFDLKRDESHDLFVNVPDVPLRPAFQEQISKFLPWLWRFPRKRRVPN